MTKDEINTREKILQVASQLFARKGFDGTSIRDIAKIADVNLAAINYHFGNKEQLYREIFVIGYNRVESQVESLDDNLNTFEIAKQIFEIMNKNSAQLRNTFAMIISDNIPEVAETAECNMCKAVPPGFKKLAKTIVKEYGSTIPLSAVHWCVSTIFMQFLQTTLMLNSQHFRQIRELQNLSNEMIEEGINHHIKATVDYMLAHQEKFQYWPFLEGIKAFLDYR